MRVRVEQLLHGHSDRLYYLQDFACNTLLLIFSPNIINLVGMYCIRVGSSIMKRSIVSTVFALGVLLGSVAAYASYSYHESMLQDEQVSPIARVNDDDSADEYVEPPASDFDRDFAEAQRIRADLDRQPVSTRIADLEDNLNVQLRLVQMAADVQKSAEAQFLIPAVFNVFDQYVLQGPWVMDAESSIPAIRLAGQIALAIEEGLVRGRDVPRESSVVYNALQSRLESGFDGAIFLDDQSKAHYEKTIRGTEPTIVIGTIVLPKSEWWTQPFLPETPNYQAVVNVLDDEARDMIRRAFVERGKNIELSAHTRNRLRELLPTVLDLQAQGMLKELPKPKTPPPSQMVPRTRHIESDGPVTYLQSPYMPAKTRRIVGVVGLRGLEKKK